MTEAFKPSLTRAAQEVEGCQLDCEFKGLDVLPLVNATHPSEVMAGAQRLRLNGRMQFDGQLQDAAPGQEASVYAGEPCVHPHLSPRWSPLLAELLLQCMRMSSPG